MVGTIYPMHNVRLLGIDTMKFPVQLIYANKNEKRKIK
jgi:hypothetical protein